LHTQYFLRCFIGCTCGCVFLMAVGAKSAPAENWPGWRGPRGDGSSLEKNIPVRWSDMENVVWKVPLPGKGHASPIIWNERIFLVAALKEKQQRVLLCLERETGKILWQRVVLQTPLERIHRLNSHATSTPLTDGEKVYVSFLDRDMMFIAAYDFQGRQIWKVHPGVFSSIHGYSSSPIIWKNKLIINGDHDGPAYIVALDRTDGRTIWKTLRPNRMRSYCTPIIRNIDGRNQLILSGGKCVTSYDPDTGKQHWIIDGPTEQFVASLVYNGDMLFMTCGYPKKFIFAIRPNGQGNVTKTHVLWQTSRDCSYVPSPLVIGSYFLIVSDKGIASCYEAKIGRRIWREDLGDRHSASLVSADGLVYFLSDHGFMTVLRPGPKLDVVSRNKLGEETYASPAISRGQIFLRGEKHLFCIGTPPYRTNDE